MHSGSGDSCWQTSLYYLGGSLQTYVANHFRRPFCDGATNAGEISLSWSRGLLGNMEQSENIVIGTREVWGTEYPFGLLNDDRRHHCYVLGKTGTGKTTLLRNLIVQDIEAGRGVGVIDPHGDLAQELLSLIPRHRIEDVAYFDPADPDYALGFNIFETDRDIHLVASGLVSAMKAIWRESWGPRLEYILYATAAALLECENVTLLGAQRMLFDPRYRVWVVKQIKDPVVRSFWINEFESYNDRFMQDAIGPVQNKVGQILMSPKLRNVLGQVKTKIDARFMMDNRRIFIANLSKGNLGEDKSNLMGALLVSQFQVAAMSRVDFPEEKREDFHLYVDEFQSFASDSFASILSEARKYRLCLTLSHQYIDQLLPEIRLAVFGNVGSMVVFRLGERDAEILERELGGPYTATQLTGLGRHEVCARILTSGISEPAFLGRTYPPSGQRYGHREKIIRRSREKYATKKAIVEEKIARWIQKPIR